MPALADYTESVDCFRESPLILSSHKLALASLNFSVAASASGCGGEKGRWNDPQREFWGPLSPWGERQSEGILY